MSESVEVVAIAERIRKEFEALGIKPQPFSIEVVNIGKGTLGNCQKVKGAKEFKIKINRTYYDLTSIKETEDTIAHEILHTVKGCYNHGLLFQKYCRILNNAYDYNLRISASRTRLVEENPELVSIYKYAVRCNNCGVTYYYFKKNEHSQNSIKRNSWLSELSQVQRN